MKKFELEENDFILINSYELSTIQSKYSKKSIFLEFSIDSNIFNRLYSNFSYIKFKCFSRDSIIEKEKYNNVHKIILKILNITQSNKVENNLLIFDLLINLIFYLIHNFKYEEISSEKDVSNRNRIIKILDFLDNNYSDENLSINDVAEYVDLSPQYLLKVFRKILDVTMSDYLNSLRIKKSLNDLLYTEKNIIEISIENGFNSSKSYHRVFKEFYNMTPGIYRKTNKMKTFGENQVLDKEKILTLLEESFIEKIEIEKTLNKNESSFIEIDLNKLNKSKINQYWKRIMSIGKAFEGLKGDIQYQIKEIKSEIDLEYVRFTGIFNDEMNIYNEDSDGNIYYNYAYVDKLLDFLIRTNLKPFINLGFMPKKIASKEQYIFSSNINVSYPKRIETWKNMVYSFIRHLIDKYGEKEVSTWYFEIWNNPDLSKIYWYESNEKFFNFFEETYNAIKSASIKIKVGGPAVLAINNLEWIESFLIYMKNKNVILDFFSYHNYNIKRSLGGHTTVSPKNIKFEEVEIAKKFTKNIYSNIKQNYFKKAEIIISEWNLTPSSSNSLSDTIYASSFIMDTVINNFSTTNGMSYWTFTENKMDADIFYGGLGLFTTNNLKKASYNAFILLNKLGNEMISKGKNHFITRKDNSLQIILYNYQKDFYKDLKSTKINLNLQNLCEGPYIITKYYLNKESGSTYDAWLSMGSPKKITEEAYQYLKSQEKMKMKIEKIFIENSLNIKELLNSNNIVFINIEKIE